jgi:hypothetical protein
MKYERGKFSVANEELTVTELEQGRNTQTTFVEYSSKSGGKLAVNVMGASKHMDKNGRYRISRRKRLQYVLTFVIAQRPNTLQATTIRRQNII